MKQAGIHRLIWALLDDNNGHTAIIEILVNRDGDMLTVKRTCELNR